MLPYFLKAEKFAGPQAEGHNDQGLLPVDDARYTTPMEKVTKVLGIKLIKMITMLVKAT